MAIGPGYIQDSRRRPPRGGMEAMIPDESGQAGPSRGARPRVRGGGRPNPADQKRGRRPPPERKAAPTGGKPAQGGIGGQAHPTGGGLTNQQMFDVSQGKAPGISPADALSIHSLQGGGPIKAMPMPARMPPGGKPPQPGWGGELGGGKPPEPWGQPRMLPPGDKTRLGGAILGGGPGGPMAPPGAPINRGPMAPPQRPPMGVLERTGGAGMRPPGGAPPPQPGMSAPLPPAGGGADTTGISNHGPMPPGGGLGGTVNAGAWDQAGLGGSADQIRQGGGAFPPGGGGEYGGINPGGGAPPPPTMDPYQQKAALNDPRVAQLAQQNGMDPAQMQKMMALRMAGGQPGPIAPPGPPPAY